MDAAVVIAGGGATRLGGIDKAMLNLGGHTLLDGVLAAVGDVPTVLVGPARTTARPVVTTLEDEPGSGPAAGIAAGVAVLQERFPTARVVAVLAADLPGLDSRTLARLCEELGRTDAPGAVLVDGSGREQWLTGVWQLTALSAVIQTRSSWAGASVKSLLGVPGLRLVAASDRETADIDTAADIASWRASGSDSDGQNGES